MRPTCVCGSPGTDSDAYHAPFHRIWEWNQRVFADARAQREATFDRQLEVTGQDAVADPQSAMNVGDGRSTVHRANPARPKRR